MEFSLRFKQHDNGTWAVWQDGKPWLFCAASAANAVLMALHGLGHDKMIQHVADLEKQITESQSELALLKADYEGLYGFIEELRTNLRKFLSAPKDSPASRESAYHLSQLTAPWPPETSPSN